jgi:hypothetical protein
LEVAYEDLTCGVEERGISVYQFEPGTTLTFERGEATGTPLSSQESSRWPAMTPVVATRVLTPCPPGTDEAAATVAAQRAIWESAAIDSYDFALRYTTDFLFGTYHISVVDGTPVSAQRVESGALTDYLDVPELPKTIVEIFEQLEREVTADRFEGEFHEQLGYPTHVLVDRIDYAVDDELEFFISDLVIHGGQSPPRSSASELTVTEQIAVYEVVIRDAYVRSANDRPDVPGIQLVDHPVADAGQTPLSISASASGEPFPPGVLDAIVGRLADLPVLGVVNSMEDVLGPDYHPTAPQTARPGVLIVVSPIIIAGGMFEAGVQVGPPGGAGWVYVVTFDGETASIVDAQSPWIS